MLTLYWFINTNMFICVVPIISDYENNVLYIGFTRRRCYAVGYN